MSQTIESALSQLLLLPSFDQIVKGNVNIKKLSKQRYRITFSKIGKFLMYQVWDKDDANKQNDNRVVKYVSAKEWVTSFKKTNNILEENKKPLFTPTTVMETENNIYAFVIHKACLNSCDKVVFTVSTEEISPQNNTSKKLVQLPEGKCNDVRFDIDNSFFPFPGYDPVNDFVLCINNFLTAEVSKNYMFSITWSNSDNTYDTFTVNGNISVETLKRYLSYSNIEPDPEYINRGIYTINGQGVSIGSYFNIYTTTLFLSEDLGEGNAYFATDKGIVNSFYIQKQDKNYIISQKVDSISFINTQNSKCPNYIIR
jgi:hypothetical protein